MFDSLGMLSGNAGINAMEINQKIMNVDFEMKQMFNNFQNNMVKNNIPILNNGISVNNNNLIFNPIHLMNNHNEEFFNILQNGKKMNIIFENPNRERFNLVMNEESTVEDTIKEYIKRYSFYSENEAKKKLSFLYNGRQIDINSQQLITKILKDSSKIIVLNKTELTNCREN